MINLKVYHNGEFKYSLNERLFRRQNLTEDDAALLVSLHEKKLKLFDMVRETDDRAELRRYVKLFAVIENTLQDTWGFGADHRFHEWYTIPKCTCPKMDNADSRGTDRRIVVVDCVMHGEEP